MLERRIAVVETDGIDQHLVQTTLERFAGIRECVLEGYRVHPRVRGFIKLRVSYYPHGCHERVECLGSVLPDDVSQDCIVGEFKSLTLPALGRAASYVVRIDYEARIRPKLRVYYAARAIRRWAAVVAADSA